MPTRDTLLERIRIGALLAGARRVWPDILLLVALVAGNGFVRWVGLDPIENGGDPLDNWYFVRQFAYENHPATAWLDHHCARFGIHWITFLVQKIFGVHPKFYYFPQLFASALCVGLVYLLGRQVAGRAVAVLAALLLIENDLFESASSQLRRGIFETAYALIVANCLVRYISTSGRQAERWLLACTLAQFLTYMVELPSLFLMPAVLLVMWLAHRNLKHLLWYCGILVGLFLVETAIYSIFTQYSSRLAVITGAHLSKEGTPHDFWYVLGRVTEADESTKLVYYTFFGAGAAILAFRDSLKERVPVLLTASFLFLMTFTLRGIDPIRVFQRNSGRYILMTVPPALVAVSIVMIAALGELGAFLGRTRAFQRFRLQGTVALLAGLAFALLLIAGEGLKGWSERRKPHAWESLDTVYSLLNDTYARKLPIIADVSKRKGQEQGWQARGLHWALKGFVRDDLLVQRGVLPDFQYEKSIEILDSERRYAPVTPELDADRVRQLEREGCAVVLRVRGSFMEVSPRSARLPARCKP